MKIYRFSFTIFSVLCFCGCMKDPGESLPRIILTDQQNRQFIYTNKNDGFFLGNSHRENGKKNEGWIVADFPYLNEYRIFLHEKPIRRDSLYQFIYHPYSAVRIYSEQFSETLTLLDSINALVWEYVIDVESEDFKFVPVMQQVNKGKQIQLTSAHRHLVFSPKELADNNGNIPGGWLGFNLLIENPNRIVVIAAVEPDKDQLNQQLKRLSQVYKQLIENRIRRLSDIFRHNKIFTDTPEITDALSWAQISLDALVCEQEDTGLCSGLPYGDSYSGRETFISLTGTFLVNGQFRLAKKILNTFAALQLTDSDDPWQGRIPTHYSKTEVAYNTTDVTWWYIRAVYEYLLYTADREFMKQIFPHVKLAIEGAIRYRIDEHFFLTHKDDETWMDSREQASVWTPRGNRAVEIQALWYTALQIGAKLAEWNDDFQLKEYWLAIAETLKKNFIDLFWNSSKAIMADHLNSDDSPDRKIRPNQIFSVYIPQLPDIQPLIPEDVAAQVINSVAKNLTYRYGVASLCQADMDFHPWYHYYPYYSTKEASFNGPVWTWLAGPVISSLLTIKRENLAFDLYYDESIQILDDDAIGNLSELKDALPLAGSQQPEVSGNLSSAWGLAEFNRNFFQDFIGFQPDAPNKRIYLNPNFSADLNYISAILFMADNKYIFSYKNKEDVIELTLRLVEGSDQANFFLEFPGFDLVNFQLDNDQTSYHIYFDPSRRRSYHIYSELDWYLAQPELHKGLKSLNKPDYPIMTSADYYYSPEEKGKNILQQNDALFDDTGDNGRYTYPLNPSFQAGIFDIEHFQIDDLNDHWGFILKMRQLVNPNWHPESGFQLTFTAIAIHYADRLQTGTRRIGRNARYTLTPPRRYHDIIFIGGGIQIENSSGKIKAQYIPNELHRPLGFTNRREIRFKIDKSLLPGLNENAVITILCGGHENPLEASIGEFLPVNKTAGEWIGGGAENNDVSSRIYDILEVN